MRFFPRVSYHEKHGLFSRWTAQLASTTPTFKRGAFAKPCVHMGLSSNAIFLQGQASTQRRAVAHYSKGLWIPTCQWQKRLAAARDAHTFFGDWEAVKDSLEINRQTLDALLSLSKRHMSPKVRVNQMSAFFHWILNQMETQLLPRDPEALYILLRRFGELNQRPILRQLVTQAEHLLLSMHPRAAAICMATLAYHLIRDDGFWEKAGLYVEEYAERFGPYELVLVFTAFRHVERRRTSELRALKSRALSLMEEATVTCAVPSPPEEAAAESCGPPGSAVSPDARSAALQMGAKEVLEIMCALGHLDASDSEFFQSALQWVKTRVTEGGSMELLRGREIATLWKLAQAWNIRNADHVDFLCTQSQTLRLDSRLSPEHYVGIAVAVADLGVRDNRILYQLVNFVKHRSAKLEGQNLVQVVLAFDSLHIASKEAWKQLAVQYQKCGATLGLNETQQLERCFHKAKMESGTHALAGHVEAFRKRAEDEVVYGPQWIYN